VSAVDALLQTSSCASVNLFISSQALLVKEFSSPSNSACCLGLSSSHIPLAIFGRQGWFAS
jgi:hypothetical protein